MRNTSIILLATVLLSGCTGTRITVSPDRSMHPTPKINAFNAIGVRAVDSDKIYPPAGNLTEGFANELRNSKFASNVYYPMRPDDKVDLTVDSKFNVSLDPHMGSGMAKAFLTGLTFFLLEPLFWYNYDYSLSANLTVTDANHHTRTVSASTEATMEMKWLSLAKAQALEGETLTKAKQSLYSQLVDGLTPAQ